MKLKIFVCLFLFINSLYAQDHSFNQQCNLTRSYKIVKFDPRFNISKGELRLALINAGNMWNKALGKKVFREAYSGQADINISLEYTDGLEVYLKAKEMISKGFEINLDFNEFSKLQEEQKEYGERLREKIYEVNRKISDLQKEINYLQKQGRFTQNKRNLIQKEMNNLRDESRKIDQEISDFNSNTSFMNDWASIINNKQRNFRKDLSFIKRLKQSGVNYHEAGLYRRIANKEDIFIKLFSDKKELKAVIAHEFGHALGLAHVKDPNSIMYYSMQEKTLEKLGVADKKALALKCGK